MEYSYSTSNNIDGIIRALFVFIFSLTISNSTISLYMTFSYMACMDDIIMIGCHYNYMKLNYVTKVGCHVRIGPCRLRYVRGAHWYSCAHMYIHSIFIHWEIEYIIYRKGCPVSLCNVTPYPPKYQFMLPVRSTKCI